MGGEGLVALPSPGSSLIVVVVFALKSVSLSAQVPSNMSTGPSRPPWSQAYLPILGAIV